jgi:hypothetical protein
MAGRNWEPVRFRPATLKSAHIVAVLVSVRLKCCISKFQAPLILVIYSHLLSPKGSSSVGEDVNTIKRPVLFVLTRHINRWLGSIYWSRYVLVGVILPAYINQRPTVPRFACLGPHYLRCAPVTINISIKSRKTTQFSCLSCPLTYNCS